MDGPTVVQFLYSFRITPVLIISFQLVEHDLAGTARHSRSWRRGGRSWISINLRMASYLPLLFHFDMSLHLSSMYNEQGGEQASDYSPRSFSEFIAMHDERTVNSKFSPDR